jgi:hypothetical protein
MNPYRFILEPYKSPASRYNCPQCDEPKTFARYIDTYAGDKQLGDHVGKCNRENSCGYHYTPNSFGMPYQATTTLKRKTSGRKHRRPSGN